MRLLRILLASFFLLIAILIVCIGCLLLFLDPNRLKPFMIAEVKKQTGYQLTIDGPLSWSFYPKLAIHADQLALYRESHLPPFVKINHATFVMSLNQLLHGKEKLAGEMNFADMYFMKIHAQQVHLELAWKNNILLLQPITANVYHGTLVGKVQATGFSSAQNNVPEWAWQVHIKQIQLKSLLNDINGADSIVNIAGLANIDMEAGTKGKSKTQILQNVAGISEIKVSEGIVEGIDFGYLMQSADALINHERLVAPIHANQTVFDRLTATIDIRHGLATSNNFNLISKEFLINGEGNVDLPQQKIDFRLQIKPVQKETVKKSWAIPILLTGELSKPYVRLDSNALQAIIVKQQIEKVKTKLKDQVKKLPDHTQELLKRFIGQ